LQAGQSAMPMVMARASGSESRLCIFRKGIGHVIQQSGHQFSSNVLENQYFKI